MFAKVKDRLDTATKGAQARPAATADRVMPSIIGPDMVIHGNLETPGEIHIEGRIEGDVACSKLNVGPTGKIHGKVKAGSVRVHGLVDGAIDAEEVFLLSGSMVSGDIVQSSLEIAPGAGFEGAVRRRGKPVPQLEAPAPVEVAVEEVVPSEDEPPAAEVRRKPPARVVKAADSATDSAAPAKAEETEDKGETKADTKSDGAVKDAEIVESLDAPREKAAAAG